MKRENHYSFYFLVVLVLFITCYLISYVCANRIIEINGLLALASVIIYPLTYFILILFSERCGKDQALILLNLAIVALLGGGVLLTVANIFPVYNGVDGLEVLFELDFRLLFASIISFYVGQMLNLYLYYYLKNKKTFNFLIAGVISITVDSFLLILLAFVGVSNYKELILLATGQYVISVVLVLFYTICFGYLISTVIDVKKCMEKNETKDESKAKVKIEADSKEKKKTSTKSKSASKTTSKTTSKSTTKTTTKKPVKKDTKKNS